MNDELLLLYINNHLAGSVAGIDIAHRSSRVTAGTEVGTFLAQLVADMEEEQLILKGVITKLGGTEQSLKKLGAWVFEKMTEVAMGDYARKAPSLARVFELEAVLLGSRARLGLWEILSTYRRGDSRLASIDFVALRDRAIRHCEKLESYRLAAGEVLAGGLTGNR